MKIKCIKVNEKDSRGFVVGNVYEAKNGIIRSDSGSVQSISKEDIGHINSVVTHGLKFEKFIEPQPKFKLGDKVVPIKKSVGSKEMVEVNKKFLDENGYLLYNGKTKYSEIYGAVCASWRYTDSCPTGDFYLESELIPYVEPKHKFKVGDKVVPHSKTVYDFECGIIYGEKKEFFDKNGFLYVCGITKGKTIYRSSIEGDVLILGVDSTRETGDYYMPSDVEMYVEPTLKQQFLIQKAIVTLADGITAIVLGGKIISVDSGQWLTTIEEYDENLIQIDKLFSEEFDIVKIEIDGKIVYEVNTKLEEAQTLLDELNRIDRELEDLQKEKDKLNKDFENIDELIEDLGFEVGWNSDEDKYVII